MRVHVLATILLLPACGSPPPPEIAAVPEELDPVVVTRWTEKSELFLEYPPLQAGETSRFAVHLTDMSSFQPLREGRVEVYLDYGGGVSEKFAADGPSRPGIFGVDVTPARPGTAAMTVQVQSPAVEDSHDLGPVSVSAEQEDMHALQIAQQEGPAGGDISFLKEQQWTLDFRDAACRAQTDAGKFGCPSNDRAAQWRPHDGSRAGFGPPAALRPAADSGGVGERRREPRHHHSFVGRPPQP